MRRSDTIVYRRNAAMHELAVRTAASVQHFDLSNVSRHERDAVAELLTRNLFPDG